MLQVFVVSLLFFKKSQNQGSYYFLANIFVGRVEGSSFYQKWYFEVVIDHIEQVTHMLPHLRIGWANSLGYVTYPGGGEAWGGESLSIFNSKLIQ